MSTVQVIGGVQKEEDGLKASQSAFRKHHKDVSDALLNISGIDTLTGEEADKDDPRPAYVHQSWPKMVYHADGRDIIVGNSGELNQAKNKGFRETPYARPQVSVADPATEKKLLLDEIKERDGKLAVQNEMLLKMGERLEALEAASRKKHTKADD